MANRTVGCGTPLRNVGAHSRCKRPQMNDKRKAKQHGLSRRGVRMNQTTRKQKQPQAIARNSKLSSSPKRRAILILGMHRSGTSAVAGVLSALGVAGPKTLIDPHDNNPRGFFESAVLRVAHD